MPELIRDKQNTCTPVEVSTEPISGTKDPTKSLKGDTQLQKKGTKAPSDGSEVTKTAMATKTVAKFRRSSKEKSAPKERRSDSQQSATPDQSSTTDLAVVLKECVLLMANANIELNLRRREALKSELHTSYRYLCAPSNPIPTELFGDDLPKAVKDIIDTNRITSRLSRETKQTFKRSRSDGHSDRYHGRYKSNYSGPSKNYRRPLFGKTERGRRLFSKTRNQS